ncbi:MAG TPA: ATP-binding protein [Gammaproteobacteria bacterium]|nr:ATP-binding protein [Gammaproteobacteria bacterium]
MFERLIAPTLQSLSQSFKIIVLTGPRQSGKTTLLRHLFPDYHYVSLESPDILLFVQQDPRGFLQSYSGHWIIDEAQNFPGLFSYLQELIDTPQEKRRFILSGSQNFLLAEHISQTLAGRAAILELLPLSYAEYLSSPNQPELSLWEFLFQGGYPRPYYEHLPLNIWYDSYIRTYLERDVRSLIHIKDLAKFQLFLRLCAGRHGQLLNMSELANASGLSHTTISHWLSILEASYIVFRLQPYHKNFNKRLVKTPKLYFYDSAIVCRLLQIESAEHLQMHASRGAIFEGFVLGEIIKSTLAKGQRPYLYFWRDHLGMEIDAIIEQGQYLQAVEIKSANTITPDYFKSLQQWKKIVGENHVHRYLVYAGDNASNRNDIQILPWNEIGSGLMNYK